MNHNTTDCNGQQIYGFLCPKTNIFYAFDSYDVYQQFLQWLSLQEKQASQLPQQAEERAASPMVTEADQLEDYERATQEIMGVFNDPVFDKIDEEVELQEIDFWLMVFLTSQWYLLIKNNILSYDTFYK